MQPTHKPLLTAFGYFCYLAGIIFFLCGAGFTVYLGYLMFSDGDGFLATTLMFPIGPILMVMGVAVFNLGRNIHNPPQKKHEELQETEAPATNEQQNDQN